MKSLCGTKGEEHQGSKVAYRNKKECSWSRSQENIEATCIWTCCAGAPWWYWTFEGWKVDEGLKKSKCFSKTFALENSVPALK